MANYSSIAITDTFNVNISYPCETATLTTPSSPFTDGSTGINEVSKTVISAWSSDSDLVTINSYLNCGAYQFTWIQSKDGGLFEPIDTDLFIVDVTNRIIIVQVADITLKGTYVIGYEVTQATYSLSATQLRAFTYHVVDVTFSCSLEDDPMTVGTQGEPPDYTYTGSTTFTAEFIINPACSITYSCVPPAFGINLCLEGILDP